MIFRPLLVTARLSSPLAGEAPLLDALLEWSLSPYFAGREKAQEPGFKITRAGPCPEMGAIPIPLKRTRLGPWLVAHSSSPILPACRETVEHVAKRISVENAGLLDPAERKVVSTTNSWTKSYRLPLRVRRVGRVCWFAEGNPREIRKALKDVLAVGKKVADGYGRVERWHVEVVADDLSWYAPHDAGRVLMRPLPRGDWLPKDLLGFRRDSCAVSPPYWHPSRLCEAVSPC